MHKTVNRRLFFTSPRPSSRIIKKNYNSDFDLSGIGQLEDEIERSMSFSPTVPNVTGNCWFQTQSVLRGIKVFIC